MVADRSDRENWVLVDFLTEIGQFSIPSYPIILGSKNGKIEFLPNQLSPPAITPKAGIKKFIDQLELYINS